MLELSAAVRRTDDLGGFARPRTNIASTQPWCQSPRNCLLVEGGECLPKARTLGMIFPVSALIAELSALCTLWPPDLISPETPAGVAASRTPLRFLDTAGLAADMAGSA
jgi:2-keto-4-pentenoate hydratase/2-oxohepta-3-ene-1,7-dioic acid hydratase in catechol pathway